MSRIGKKIIIIPYEVTFHIEKDLVKVKGPYGTLIKKILPLVTFELNLNQLIIHRITESKESKAYHGLIRSLIQNMINGVTNKITKILLMEGVGYKFKKNENFLTLMVGYTHSIKFDIPESISITLESPTKLIVNGISNEEVTLFASKIYNIKPPEPYKGKGIFYEGQNILRKAGKTRK